jgi:diguanylate cyclase (GGDEF)-like protein
MVPNHEDHWFEIYGRVARTGEDIRFENTAAAMERHYDVFAFRVGEDGSNRVGILFRDITEHKDFEQDLIAAALHDSLTGLPNRAMFREHLAKALARAERGDRNLALLFVDLNGFKAVNDNFGHLVGDDLLRTVARRLTSTVRAGDFVSRFGGDEFTVILENCELDRLPEIVQRFSKALEAPIEIGGQQMRISASIGIVTYPESATNGDVLIQMADAAMYAAKRDRKLIAIA